MPRDLAKTYLFHITPVENLPSIIAQGHLLSDALVDTVAHEVIGHSNIKERRLTRYRVPCCGHRFVGEFVPFYFCARSPMLYTINAGATGKPRGYQREIVHLVTSVERALALEQPWAISDGNAGAGHTTFAADLDALEDLDWGAITADKWQGRQHEKAAEFLVADRFPWSAIFGIGCMDEGVVERVQAVLGDVERPKVAVRERWYYT